VTDREIKIPITGDSSDYKKSLKDAEDATGKFGKKTGEVGKALAGAFVAGGVVAGIHDIVDAASDYNETVSKTKVVLGDAAEGAIDFAENAAESFGLSQQAALDAQATFAVFGKSAGLAGDDLGEFSSKLTGLAADMASFSNTSPQQAIDAIGAALRGESEPIRAYGVLLDDATLRQEAMAMGIYDGTGSLTAQQKVLAAQSAIFKQTSDAQGDFARTSGGLAGQQKILSAEIENLKVSLGEHLIPVAIHTIQTILDVGNAFGDAAFGVKISTAEFKKFFDTVKPQSVKQIGDALHKMMAEGQDAPDFFEKLSPSELTRSKWDNLYRSIKKMAEDSPGSVRNVIDALRDLQKAAAEGDPAAQKLIDDYEITGHHLDDLYDKFVKVTPAMAETTRETDKLSGAMDDAGFVAATMRLELQKQSIAMQEAADEAGAAKRATDNLAASWDILEGTLSDQQAWIDVEDSFDDVKQKGQEAWKAAAEGADDAAQKARDYQSALIGLKQKVMDYAKEVGGLPPDQVTRILAEIDEGSITTAEQVLNEIARTRQVIYNAQVTDHREFTQPSNPHKAAGGPVTAGMAYTVGERGQETFVPNTNGTIIPHGVDVAGGTTHITANIYMPVGSNGDDVVRSIQKFERRNGPGWRS